MLFILLKDNSTFLFRLKIEHMKRFLFLVIPAAILSINSCTSDIGTIQVTYQEATAIYGDLDQIRATPLNESPQEIGDPGKLYVAENFILIGEEEKGIHVIDNSDPANPRNINFINIPGNREYFVKDNFIYAESYYDVVKVNISDPSNAILEARAEFVFQDEVKDASGNTLVGFNFKEVTKELDQHSHFYYEVQAGNYIFLDFARNIIPKSAVPASFAGNSAEGSGTVNRVAYSQDHVYILGQNDLKIIADSPALFEVVNADNFVHFGNDMETIFPYDNKLFIGSRSSMDVYDLSDAENPKYVYSFQHATSCDPVLPVEDAAYVTLRTADFSPCPGNINALVVIDISDLNNASQVMEIQMASPYGMTFFNDQLFVGEGENGLRIFNATNKLAPELIVWDKSIKAYDVLPHPSNSSLVLIAGPFGLDQYQINNDLSLNLKSSIAF